MSEAAKRVVVIQDASRNISSIAIKWILKGLQLKPGDTLILLGVLHQVNTPSAFHFMGAKNLLGCKGISSNPIVGVNKTIIKEAVESKMEEYDNSTDVAEIRMLYETNQILHLYHERRVLKKFSRVLVITDDVQVEFNVKVVAAASPKTVALDIVKMSRATWIILDRQMKKDKKYFLEGLTCGISRMKRDDIVVELRGPKDEGTNKMQAVRRLNTAVTCDEMIAGTSDNEISPKTPGTCDYKIPPKTPATPEEDLFSLELSPFNVAHLING